MTTLAQDLARALDPVLVAESIGLSPDPWQARFLRSSAPRSILNCCRQSGKSTMTAVTAVHNALYTPGSLTLILSHAQRQSQELFRKAIGIYRVMGRPVPPETENQLSLSLENGSRIVCLPGKESTVRGFSGVSVLIVDEAARVPDELYSSVRPMIAVSGGRLILLSTPYGRRGFFYDAWREGGPWERFEVPATDCPRISAETLEEERRTLGEWFFRQEYNCEFLATETSAFNRDDIEAAFSDQLEEWTI